MRYAIFSDVHANRQAWEAVRADMARMEVDTLVCLGDVVGYGPKPQEVLSAVREVTPNFVLGNHDAAACGRLDPSIFNERARTVIEWTRGRLDEESLAYLSKVPLQMDGSGVQFVHAEMLEPGEFGYVDGPAPAELNLRCMTQPIGFIGHTHLPLAYAMPRKGGQVTQQPPIDFQLERGKRYLVNVGSVGEPRTTDVRASYVIYDDTTKTVNFRKVAFDVEGYKADLEETGLDIRPYFVQVVEANMHAGAEHEVAPAPQLAMAQLPSVVEVVAGHHGHLIVGNPGGAAAWGSGVGAPGVGIPAGPIQQPRTMPVPAIVALGILVLACVGGLVAYTMRDRGGEVASEPVREAAPDPEKERRAALERANVAARTSKAEVDAAKDEVPIKNLTVRLFAQDVESLEQLRKAAEDEKAGEKAEVPDGLLSLESGGNRSHYGLVWEGSLVVPESGDYEFTLGSGGGLALLVYWDKVLEVSGTALKKAKVKLRKGHAPFRVEYVPSGGGEGLSMTWAGPGLEEPQSLVQSGSSGGGASIAGTPSRSELPVEAPSRPEPKRVAPEKLSDKLVAYWSFDSAGGGASRIVRKPDGTVTETLVNSDQRIQVLVPTSDPGASWTKPSFDATDWTQGKNGVGYEDTAGVFKDLIKIGTGKKPKAHPHTVFIRIPFEVDDPEVYSNLALMMKYDDGFTAYLNGNQIASRNAPIPAKWNSSATAPNDDNAAVAFEPFKVTRSLKYLKKGWNFLAIQGFNNGGTPNASNDGCPSTDMLILPELVALRKDDGPAEKAAPKRSAHDLVIAPESIEGKVEGSEGKFGGAYNFKGGSIEIGSKNDYAIGEESFTVSMWFTRDPDSADKESRRLISAGAGGDKNAGWAVWLTRDVGALNFVVGDGKSRATVAAKHDSLANGKWHHLAATVYRPTEMVHIFIDGELVADQSAGLLKDASLGAASGLSIGRNSDDKQPHLGKLDDIALWNRALLPEEIEKIYESGKGLGEIFEGE